MVENEEWVSLREFARRAGVNVNAVSGALKSGRIERRESDKKIHWPTQWGAWTADRDESKVRDDDEEPEEEGLDGSVGAAFKRAKARKETALAGLKELELEEARGEMIRASHVRAATAEVILDVREAVMTIADRIASELAATLAKKFPGADSETVKEEVHRVWRRESRLVLEKLAECGGLDD